MTLEVDHDSADPATETRNALPGKRPLVRHAVLNLFNLIILLPLAWVLLMSVKTLPEAMRGNFWPKHFDFTHYVYVFQRIATLPVNCSTASTSPRPRCYSQQSARFLPDMRSYTSGPLGASLVVSALLVSLYFPVRVVSIISIYETQHWLGLINNTSGLDSALHYAATGDQYPYHAEHVPNWCRMKCSNARGSMAPDIGERFGRSVCRWCATVWS